MSPDAGIPNINNQQVRQTLHGGNNNQVNSPKEAQNPVIEWNQSWQRWLVEENQILRNAIWNLSVAVRTTIEAVFEFPPVTISPLTPFPPESPWTEMPGPALSKSTILNRTIEKTFFREEEFAWAVLSPDDAIGMMISLSSFPSVQGIVQKQELHLHTITKSVMDFVMSEIGENPTAHPLNYPKMAKMFVYNCEGLNNPVTRSDIRQILLDEEPCLVLLTGIKATEPVVSEICKSLALSDFKCEDCENGEGGIFMLWNSMEMSVKVATSDAYNIHAIVKMEAYDQYSSDSEN